VDDRRLLDSHVPPSAQALAAIQHEFADGFALIDRIDRPAVAVFGSARLLEGSPEYAAARAVGGEFARRRWAVITGGGPGLMEAANRGAREAGGLSVGLGIELPREQHFNAYLDLAYTFDHFYARKVCFVKPSEGFVVLPGGFGTLDEAFEALTLIQTGKARRFPVVLLGSAFWSGLLEWVRVTLAGLGTISAADLGLISVTDDVAEAADIVVGAYESAPQAEPPPEGDEGGRQDEPLGEHALDALEQ
jgi:uncharacterized protein (TIGR00730 family)